MFGKPRDTNDSNTFDTSTLDTSALDGIFGDEAAAANQAEVHELQGRVEQVEAQINSQFTSLATYAQIAQEQVEFVRAEARAATERSERRMMALVDRERADRITSFTGEAPAGSSIDATARLDALEQSVAQIKQGLDDCRQQQQSLADAITTFFERATSTPTTLSRPAAPAPGTSFAPPTVPSQPLAADPAPRPSFTDPISDPISGLALNG